MAGRPPTSAAERFAEKCKPAEGGCIEWTGGATKNGYGVFHCGPGKRMRLAHRWAFIQAHGDVTDDTHICHRCDNRRCVNLKHLFAGSRADNMRDASAKGRLNTKKNQGERHPGASLTDAAVLEIRRAAAQGQSTADLAQEYGVAWMVAYNAIKKITWKHL